MFKLSVIAFITVIIYYFNTYRIYSYTIDDDIMKHHPLLNEPTPSDDNGLSMMIVEYYKDLNTFIMPTQKIIPLEVFYDHDHLSFSKTVYECVDYYDTHHIEIMKNTKHMKIIVINSNEKSYCIMNTDLIV